MKKTFEIINDDGKLIEAKTDEYQGITLMSTVSGRDKNEVVIRGIRSVNPEADEILPDDMEAAGRFYDYLVKNF